MLNKKSAHIDKNKHTITGLLVAQKGTDLIQSVNIDEETHITTVIHSQLWNVEHKMEA